MRPTKLEEVYTIAQQSSSGSWVGYGVSILKSWYKITKIEVETEWTARANQWGNMAFLLSNQPYGGTWTNSFRFAIWTGRNNYGRLEYQYNGSWTNSFSFSGNSSSYNQCKYVIERNNCSATVNWATVTHTYNTTESNIAGILLEWTSVAASIYATQWTIWPATITVTYW